MIETENRLMEYYKRAKQAFTEGRFSDVIHICQNVLDNIENTNTMNTLFTLQIMRLMLATSDIGWRGQSEIPGGPRLPELFDEAENLARKENSKSILAQIMQMRASWLLYTTGVLPALETLREAWAIARESEDQLTEFVVMSALGHQTVKLNMDDGIALLYRAQELYSRHRSEIAAADQSPELIRSQLMTRASLGINEFDRGNYDKAHTLLTAALDQCKNIGMIFDLPVILNFLAQVEIASGQFESAEVHLKEAISLFDEHSGPNAWNGNNLALLAKLYIEWEQPERSGTYLEQSWKETKLTHNLDLISLVRNYYGEYLIHPNNKSRNLEQAEQMLLENITETRKATIHRSTIQSLSLMSLLMTYRGKLTEALSFGKEAVTLLDQVGNMPALRVEEIYFNYYYVLAKLELVNDAKHWLERAYEALQTIVVADEQTFLNRIPLNRSILSAYKSLL